MRNKFLKTIVFCLINFLFVFFFKLLFKIFLNFLSNHMSGITFTHWIACRVSTSQIKCTFLARRVDDKTSVILLSKYLNGLDQIALLPYQSSLVSLLYMIVKSHPTWHRKKNTSEYNQSGWCLLYDLFLYFKMGPLTHYCNGLELLWIFF